MSRHRMNGGRPKGLHAGAWRLGEVTRDVIAMGRRNPHLQGGTDNRTREQ